MEAADGTLLLPHHSTDGIPLVAHVLLPLHVLEAVGDLDVRRSARRLPLHARLQLAHLRCKSGSVGLIS